AQVARAGVARAGREAAPRGGPEGGDGAGSGHESGLQRADPALVFGPASSLTGVEAAVAPGGVDAASRLARILEVRDSAATAPMGHVLLRVDNGSGGEDLIRVDLRGNAVGASIDLANGGDAERMLSRLPERQRARGVHGLEGERLGVRGAGSGGREATEVLRATIAAAVELARGGAGARTGSDAPASRERENEPHGQARRDA